MSFFGIAILGTSCSSEPLGDAPTPNYQTYPIHSLEDVGIFKCDFNYNSSDELTSLSFDNGETHNCTPENENIKKIVLPKNREISCEYDSEGRLTGYQDLEGELRQWYQIGYGEDEYPTDMSVLQGTLDDNKHWVNQIIYTIEDIVYEQGAIKSATYVIYLSNSPSQTYSMSFQTTGDDNPLFMNVAYIVSPEFVDFMFNLSKFSRKNVNKVTITEIGNSSNTYDVNLSYQLNSTGLPTKITLIHPFNTRERLFGWE